MLDENLVFQRTPDGEREAAAPHAGLSPPLARALRLVDGTRTVAALAASFRPGEVDGFLATLQERGLVSLAGGGLAPLAAAPAAPPALSFEETRRRAVRAISDRLGPNGESLARRVEACATPQELASALAEAEAIVASGLGAEAGRAFARRLGKDPA